MIQGTQRSILVSQDYMRPCSRIILPVVGLLLFAWVTGQSVWVQRSGWHGSPRYFWWGSIALDSDPLNKHQPVAPACQNAAEHCSTWNPKAVIAEPGNVEMLVAVSGLPAFAISSATVSRLGRLGVNEIWTFMISTPLLLLAWYCLVGWLLDRLASKLQHKSSRSLKMS